MWRVTVWLSLLGLLAILPLPAAAGGKLLGKNVQVTDRRLGDFNRGQSADAVARENTVYAVWLDERETGTFSYSIYFAKSTDGGATWGRNVRVNNIALSGTSIEDPAIALGPNGVIWVIWYLRFCFTSSPDRCGGQDSFNDVRVARSLDGGETFQEGRLWDGNDDFYESDDPELAVDNVNGNVYVLIHPCPSQNCNDPGKDVYLLAYDKTGNPLRGPKVSEGYANARVGDDAFTTTRMALAARDGTICAAWEDRRHTNAVYGTCSTNQGRDFGPNVALSGANGSYPRLAIAPDGSVYAAYQQNKNIFVRRSTDNGASWSAPTAVTDLGEFDTVFAWDIAVDDNGTVVVVWPRFRSRFGGESDLFLSSSIDRGQTFSAIKIDDEGGDFGRVSTQEEPSVAVLGSGVNARAVVVWDDDRNTNDRIWSARAEVDGVPPTAPQNLQAVSGDTSVALTWDESTDSNGIQGYHVLRAASRGGPYRQITPFPVTTTAYRDVGLRQQPYFYKVVAVDGTGNTGPGSNADRATPTVGTDLDFLAGTIASFAGGDIRLRTLPELGVPRQLARGVSPQFARNGKRLYYYSGGAISSVPVRGGAAQTYFQAPGLTELYDLAADQTYFAAIYQQRYFGNQLPGGWCDAFEPRYRQIGQNDLLYADPTTIARDLALSADRRWLVYTATGFCNNLAINYFDNPNFCVADLTTGERNCIIADYQDPDFAPQSNWLVFAADFTGQREIWKAKLGRNGKLSNFTQLTRGPLGMPASAPAWSSDGNWIVFQRDVNTGAAVDLRLFAVRADGDSLRALNVAGSDPAWFGGEQ